MLHQGIRPARDRLSWRNFLGLSMSTVLLLYFNPQYLFILAVNIATIVGIALTDWAVEDDGRGMSVRRVAGHISG